MIVVLTLFCWLWTNHVDICMKSFIYVITSSLIWSGFPLHPTCSRNWANGYQSKHAQKLYIVVHSDRSYWMWRIHPIKSQYFGRFQVHMGYCKRSGNPPLLYYNSHVIVAAVFFFYRLVNYSLSDCFFFSRSAKYIWARLFKNIANLHALQRPAPWK